MYKTHPAFSLPCRNGFNSHPPQVSINLLLVFKPDKLLRKFSFYAFIIPPFFGSTAFIQNPTGKFKVNFLYTSLCNTFPRFSGELAESAQDTEKAGKTVKRKKEDFAGLFQTLGLAEFWVIPIDDPAVIFI